MNADIVSLIVGAGVVVFFLIILELLDKEQKNKRNSNDNGKR
jgi:hypothetical protein